MKIYSGSLLTIVLIATIAISGCTVSKPETVKVTPVKIEHIESINTRVVSEKVKSLLTKSVQDTSRLEKLDINDTYVIEYNLEYNVETLQLSINLTTVTLKRKDNTYADLFTVTVTWIRYNDKNTSKLSSETIIIKTKDINTATDKLTIALQRII